MIAVVPVVPVVIHNINIIWYTSTHRRCMFVLVSHNKQCADRQTDREHTWRVLGEAYADLVEAIPEGVDHLRDPLVPPLERPQIGDVSQALGAALVLPETPRRAASAERVIAREHHRIFQDTADESTGGG